MNRMLRDCAGSTLVEFTIVFPIFMLLAFGTVDVTYMLYDWALANKAAYAGAHRAIVSNPVAGGITNLTYVPSQIGQQCFKSDGSLDTTKCPSAQSTCTPTTDAGSCTSPYTFDNAAFTTIFDRMQSIFPRLQRQNVTIAYKTNNLGFDGRPDGLPMNVTVSIVNMTHQFYFLGGLMAFFGSGFADPPIPSFSTTLTSEDMVTN